MSDILERIGQRAQQALLDSSDAWDGAVAQQILRKALVDIHDMTFDERIRLEASR